MTTTSFDQYRLVPSGCQVSSNKYRRRFIAADAHAQQIAFCSSLGIYIYQTSNFELVRLLAGGFERNITAFHWNSLDSNYIATSTIDGLLVVWELQKSQPIHNLKLAAVPNVIQWNLHQRNQLLVACTDGKVLTWTILDSAVRGTTAEIFTRTGHVPSAIACHPKTPQCYAVAFSDGVVMIYRQGNKNKLVSLAPADSEKKKSTSKSKDSEKMINDMEWDPLSNVYLLVACKLGKVHLWDIESQQPIQTFDKQGAGITALAWIAWEPGNFATCNSKTGILRMWNASQRQPMDLVRVGNTGIEDFIILEETRQALCHFIDGSVGVFSMTKRLMEWQSTPGHTETIFDIQYQPSNENTLATCSYDGTIRIWDTESMQCQMKLQGQEGILYSIAWAPTEGDTRIASSSSLGDVFIWNTELGMPLVKMKHHKGAVYKVSWNSLDPTLIASSSHDKTLVISNDSGDLVYTYKLPTPAFGCHWSGFDATLVAVACLDGIVRVFDTSKGVTGPMVCFNGHKAKAFHVAWNPLIHGVLASGSDDKTIHVYNLKPAETISVLHGHTSHVRALVWNLEIPFVLISGSWDHSIRVWHAGLGECLYVVNEHLADVYGITCHPNRPFVYASTSRDTTLRFWNLHGNLTQACYLKATIEQSMKSSVTTTRSDNTKDVITQAIRDIKYSGRQSCELSKMHTTSKVDYYESLFTYYEGNSGLNELFHLMRRKCQEQIELKSSGERRILHRSEVLDVSLEKAKCCEVVRKRLSRQQKGMLSPTSAKREDQLRLSASMYLKCGNLRRYCELQMELKEYEHALALAPAVSMAFWQQLVAQYADHLMNNQSEQVVGYLVASDQIPKVIEFYRKRNQLDEAFLVAVANAQGNFNPRTPVKVMQQKVEEAEEDPEKVEVLLELRQQMAQDFSSRGQAVLAACCHLSVDDHRSAIQKLVTGHLIELAYAVSICTMQKAYVGVVEILMAKCEKAGLWDWALTLAKQLPNRIDEVGLLWARYPGTTSEKDNFRQAAQLRGIDSFQASAEKNLKQKNFVQATRDFLLADQMTDAAEAAVDGFNHILQGSTWNMYECTQLAKVVGSLDLTQLEQKVRSELLAFMNFVGAQRALWKGYRVELVNYLISNVKSLVRSQHLTNFPIALSLLTYQQAYYESFTNLEKAQNSIANIDLCQEEMDKELQSNIEHLSTFIAQGKLSSAEYSSRNLITMAAANLPKAGARYHAKVSIISGTYISGPSVVLEDNQTRMSVEEAIMWTLVNPFSPLNTGERLNPF